MFETNPDFGWEHASAAPANALDWRDDVDAFDDVAVYSEFSNQLQQSPGAPPRAEVFESRYQDWNRSVWFVLATDGGTSSAAETARSVLKDIDPLIPMAQTRPLQEVWQASMARDRFILTLLGAFGALALILSTVGVYGVTAQAARRRTQEIGIRMALGAGGGQVVGMMLFQGMALVALGTLLYGVAPTDPPTRRATAVDPLQSLRSE